MAWPPQSAERPAHWSKSLNEEPGLPLGFRSGFSALRDPGLISAAICTRGWIRAFLYLTADTRLPSKPGLVIGCKEHEAK